MFANNVIGKTENRIGGIPVLMKRKSSSTMALEEIEK
jgi:hypothetical protein